LVPSIPPLLPALISLASWNINQGLSPSKLAALGKLLDDHDVVLLQEFSLLSLADRHFIQSCGFIIYAPVGSCTGILFHHSFQPKIKELLFDDESGRAVGILLSHRRQSLLISSVYLPTGLDSQSDSSADSVLARSIYSTVMSWCQLANLCIVGGDMNETTEFQDRVDDCGRFSGSRGRILSSSLFAYGFKDAFREKQGLTPGYTCFRQSTRTQSRIDYFLTKGALEVKSIQVQPDPVQGSDHRPLSASFLLSGEFSCSYPLKPLRLPNMRKLTTSSSQLMIAIMESLFFGFIYTGTSVTSTSMKKSLHCSLSKESDILRRTTKTYKHAQNKKKYKLRM